MSLKSTISEFIRLGTELLLPRVCAVCGCSLTPDEEAMCLDCFLNLPRTQLHRCSPTLPGHNRIQDRLAWMPQLTVAGGWFYYSPSSPYAALIRSMKYESRPSLGEYMGKTYAQELMRDRPDIVRDFDVLVPVGMHWRKEMKRGYNQSLIVARAMAAEWSCTVEECLYMKHRHSSQTRRGADDRLLAVKNLFDLENTAALSGKHVVLVDDIITTGATAAAALRTILDNSRPACVSLLALGVTES